MVSAGRCWSYRGCPSGAGMSRSHLHAAVADRDADQHVVVAGGFRHGVDQPVGGVVDRRAGDAERVDVAARQVGQRHRGTDVRPPGDLAGRLVEPVDRVALGRRDHQVADQQRLAVDRAVQVHPPAHRQPTRPGRVGGTGAGEVVPVGGPGGVGMPSATRVRGQRPGRRRRAGRRPPAGAARRGGQDAARQCHRREPGRTPESHPHPSSLLRALPSVTHGSGWHHGSDAWK